MSVTLSTTIGPVTIKEAFEDYEAGIDLSRGPYLNKVYLCPSWASAFPVVNALMGSGTHPVRHACPESPNLRCINAVVAPKGEYDIKDSGRPQFNLPLIKTTYAIPTWEELVTDDPSGNQSFPNSGTPFLYMEQSVDFDTEVIKLPNRAYAFASDGTPVDAPVHCTIAVAQFVITRKWQAILPVLDCTTYLNALNDSTFLGQPRGTVKFRKARTRRTGTSDGERTQEVELVFQWRTYDHNKQHRPEHLYFELIVDSSGNNPYQYMNLSNLLI